MSFLDLYLDNTKVCIFSKTTCGYCNKAKSLLNTYTNNIIVYELDGMNEGNLLQNNLKNITGQSTVPNIFIKGKHIGGYNDLEKLHKNNSLHSIINKTVYYQCSFCGKCFVNEKKFECNCFQRSFDDWGQEI